jgi:hypothetical protein
MAHDGLARAVYPVHTSVDGDLVFAASVSGPPEGSPEAILDGPAGGRSGPRRRWRVGCSCGL